MIVAVGSRNPSKVKAVEEVFKRFFHEVTVKSVPVRLSVSPQPISLMETIKGAVERAYQAILKIKDSKYGVGIEAGLMHVPYTVSGFFDFQLCAIVDKDLRFTIGSSSAFEFPPEVIDKVLRREVSESETVFEEITGISGIGDKMGAVGFLTKGLVERRKLSEQAVTSALIPRINQTLYDKPWPKVWEVLNLKG